MLHRSRTAGSLLAALMIALPLGAQTGTWTGTTGLTADQATATATTDYCTTQNDYDDDGEFTRGWLGLLGRLGRA